MVLTILSKLGLEYSVFLSKFHSVRLASEATWTIPSLEAFIESPTQEKNNIINMEKIKCSKAHELTMKDGSGHQYQKSKDKDKRK
jgi:ABC-type Zn2+ transport system substrate-binding protein/surface adhesin